MTESDSGLPPESSSIPAKPPDPDAASIDAAPASAPDASDATEPIDVPAVVPVAQPPAALAPQPPGAQPPAGPLSGAPPPGPQPGYASPPYEVQQGPGLLVRALWFIFIGWWLTGIVSTIAWLAMITIIGLPLGIWLINRIPTVITLRQRTREVQQMVDAAGFTRFVDVPVAQVSWPVRGIWFILVGWWASAIVMTIGFFLVVLIITLPLGLMLYNRVPFVASLYRY